MRFFALFAALVLFAFPAAAQVLPEIVREAASAVNTSTVARLDQLNTPGPLQVTVTAPQTSSLIGWSAAEWNAWGARACADNGGLISPDMGVWGIREGYDMTAKCADGSKQH